MMSLGTKLNFRIALINSSASSETPIFALVDLHILMNSRNWNVIVSQIFQSFKQAASLPHLIIRAGSRHCLGQILLVGFSKICLTLVSKVEKEIIAAMWAIHFRLQNLVQCFGKRHAGCCEKKTQDNDVTV